MSRLYTRTIAARATPGRTLWLPAATVMAGSAMTLLPVVAETPFLPPLGLLMLIGWRLSRPEVWRIWAPLPLGLFDDLVSGQPFGSAALFWTLSFMVIDILDRRLVWRDFWQDWVIAAGTIALCLIGGRLVATRLEAHVDTVLALQITLSIILYPAIALLCARLDKWRLGE